MAHDIAPELFAQRFLEQVTSHEARIKEAVRFSISRQRIHRSAEATTLTSAMSGRLVLLDTTTVDYTLPAIADTDTDDGLFFDFLATSASTASSGQTIVAQTGDLLKGGVTIVSSTAGGTDTFAPDGSDDLTISLNATTSGGATAGSFLHVVAIDGNWWVSGVLLGSGTVVTCFS